MAELARPSAAAAVAACSSAARPVGNRGCYLREGILSDDGLINHYVLPVFAMIINCAGAEKEFISWARSSFLSSGYWRHFAYMVEFFCCSTREL